ncbi:rhodanese-like domain-containing protein [Reinekea blandensis]|uniref:Rhodanese-like protein n=1 Tax=Reinekea blandensis MED297 TaxID=314283 RepID=A4BE91_9GAMM|nr:rhodanese-like domain-containing protein [Reinekea blandensis]EAR09569.1 Rhodanese-like protein [Reinekea blandensis MED297]
MLEQLLEFVLNHWILSLIWVTLLILLIRSEGSRGGKAISPTEVTLLINKEDAKVIDIRSKEDFRNGHLPNAINIPSRDVQKRLSEIEAYKDQPIILICKTGTTAGATGSVLAKAGFTKLNKLRGGIMEWQGANLPLVKG